MKEREPEARGDFSDSAARGFTPAEVSTQPSQAGGDSAADVLTARTVGPAPIPVVPVGAVIAGRYRVVELLGEGGMGQVFVAENMSIRLQVAIKVLRPELLANAAFQTRFLREAQAIATIDHPNVVRFLDLVLGYPAFLVMELVRGPTLRELLQRDGPLDARRAISIGERLAWALAAVHAAGVIHRDLKPSNVIIAKDRELGLTPKIIDFGVVRLASASDGQELTRVGQFVGTLHYVAPEQISTGEVDGRADLYALGAVLYRMLAGEPPFAGASDETQLLYRVLEHDPPRLPAKPDTPPELAELVHQLLAKNPESRPRDAAAVAERLKAIRARLEPASATALPARLRMGWRARLGYTLMAIALGSGAFLGWTRWSAPPHLDPRAPGAALMISSRPSGASVQIDGRKLAHTTPLVESGLSRGRHSVMVSLADHAPIQQIVDLSGKDRDAILVALAGTARLVEIQTTPRDATVFFNGEMAVQRTPVKIEIAADEFYQLQIERSGYQTLTTRITPEDHQDTLTFALEPERAPRGALVVDSNVGGRVFVDGRDTGLVTPTRSILLPAGPHMVEVQSGAGSASQHITLRQGETAHLLLEPLPLHPGR